MSMSPDDLQDDYDDNDDSSVIRQLRQQLKQSQAEQRQLQEQVAAASQAEQKVAFYEAKLPDLNERQRQAILATAETPTPEGFRLAAEELGFVAPPEPKVSAQELDALNRISSASNGANMPDPAMFTQEIAAANSEAEVAAVMAKYGHNLYEPQ